MSQPFVPTTYIPKERVNFERNVGGVNYGRTENTLENVELADGSNFELDPQGGFRVRLGTQLWIPNLRYVDFQLVDHTGLDSMGAVIQWPTPSGSRRLLAVNTSDGLLQKARWFLAWSIVPFGAIYKDVPVEEGD